MNSLFKETIRLMIAEAPIRDFDVIGNKIDPSKPGSFDKKDRKLLSNPKAIEKIKRQWEKTEYVFDMYLLNVPKLNKSEFREKGVVDPGFRDFIKDSMGIDLPNNPDSITILFNGNSGAEKVPLTGWMVAHRFGHAVRNISSFQYYIEDVVDLTKRILDEVYGKTINKFRKDGFFDNGWDGNSAKIQEKMIQLFFNQIGSFKSAKESKINRYFEFFYELFAQYLLTGSILFRPLSRELIIGTLPFGRKETAYAVDEDLLNMWNRDLEIYANQIESRIINVLEDCVGKTFLM